MASFNDDKNITYGAKMKVIGVGGGGGNMVNHMVREGYNRIELIAANTDSQALQDSQAGNKIQLGATKTKGLGAGMVPEVGKEAAEESYDEIKNALESSDIVFIAAGLGGGTGTGAAPVIARAAKENKALTVGVVTIPFDFEGKKRLKLAQEGLEELKKECDTLLVVQNQKLLSLVDKKAGLKESFKKVDDILAHAVNGMVSVILDHGESDINADFADVRRVMSYRGVALMGVGTGEGDNAVEEALKDAIQSPLLNDMTIEGAMGVLIHLKLHTDCSLLEISEAIDNIVTKSANENADIIFSTVSDDSIENNRVEVTIIATGFEEGKNASKPKPVQKEQNSVTSLIDKRLGVRRVSGDFIENEDMYSELEKPTYLRNKMD